MAASASKNLVLTPKTAGFFYAIPLKIAFLIIKTILYKKLATIYTY